MIADEVETPLGSVYVTLDANRIPFEVWDEPVSEHFPVDANKRIKIRYQPNGKRRTMVCRFQKTRPCDWSMASGERLEAIELFDDATSLIVATSWEDERSMASEGIWDYDVEMWEWGLVLRFEPSSRERNVVFGISWISGYDEETRTNPWLMGDPMCWGDIP